MYTIQSRYQYHAMDGIQWTGWFIVGKESTLELAEKELVARKEMSKAVDKATKLKHEYKIIEI